MNDTPTTDHSTSVTIRPVLVGMGIAILALVVAFAVYIQLYQEPTTPPPPPLSETESDPFVSEQRAHLSELQDRIHKLEADFTTFESSLPPPTDS